MIQELIDILSCVKAKFSDNSDMDWTTYEKAKEVRDELDDCIEKLSQDDKNCLDNLNIHFLPTSTFQEHSIQNDWTKEYMLLSEKFDRIYNTMKDHRQLGLFGQRGFTPLLVFQISPVTANVH